MDELAKDVWQGVSAPLLALVQPGERVYLAYLLVAALLATGVWWVKLRRRTSLVKFLFSRRIWLHRSALLDYRLMFVRGVIDATLLAPLAFSSVAVAYFSLGLFAQGLGAGPFSGVAPGVALVTFTLVSFVAEDAARYVVHRLAHRVPVLWELHKVHHSAEVLTPFTVFRTHPIESLLMRSGAMLAIGVSAGACSWLFGRGVVGWEIAGVHALSLAWAAFGANLRHSQVWLSYGRVLEHVFISPAQHQIHHSTDARHYDRNFGSAFALWDWIGGSLYVTRGRERLEFGLPAEERNHDDTVLSAIVSPISRAARVVTARYQTTLRSGARGS